MVCVCVKVISPQVIDSYNVTYPVIKVKHDTDCITNSTCLYLVCTLLNGLNGSFIVDEKITRHLGR